MKVNKFNIRVYAFIIKGQSILISDEKGSGHYFTKFPGGGLELEEGLKEGLERELQEELDLSFEVGDLVHITESFIQSKLRPSEQVIAVYYLANSSDIDFVEDGSVPENADQLEEYEVFKWVPLRDIKPEMLTFESDKQALKVLLDTLNA